MPPNKPFTKIAAPELLEILDLWEFGRGVKEKVSELIAGDENLRGPHLFRYYNLRPSKVEGAEEELRKFLGSTHCLATNSGTSALLAAYRALGIGAGDEVLVPAYGFLATAATVVCANAIPVIVDIDDSLCMSAHEFETLANLHHSGRRFRTASRWSQLVAMTMAQLSGRTSLRDDDGLWPTFAN